MYSSPLGLEHKCHSLFDTVQFEIEKGKKSSITIMQLSVSRVLTLAALASTAVFAQQQCDGSGVELSWESTSEVVRHLQNMCQVSSTSFGNWCALILDLTSMGTVS